MFEQAKASEYDQLKYNTEGSAFYWCGDESLEELEKPERMAAIEKQWEERKAKKRKSTKLVQILTDVEFEDGEDFFKCSIVEQRLSQHAL